MVGFSLFNVFLNSGERTVSAGAASFIASTVPIVTAVLATLFLGEHIAAWGWLGAVISIGGIGLIALGQPGGLSFGSGACLVFGAAICQASYFILLRPMVPRYGALPSTAYALLSGALFLTPFLPNAVATLRSPATNLATNASVAFLGIVPGVLGYAAWTYAIGHFGAARASNFLFLIPLVATAIAFIISAEIPARLTLLGGIIVVIGVILVNTKGRSAHDA
jgi:drug/metabolite transporter (DMT)-like permease